MPGLSFVPANKYSTVPEKAPGRLYTVGEVGKMKYVNRANKDGWYTRFDAATGAYSQLDGKFSEYTIKYPYDAVSSSICSRSDPENESERVSSKTTRSENENEKGNLRRSSSHGLDDLDLTSLQFSSPRDDTYSSSDRVSTGRIRTDLVELAEKKNRLNKKLQIVDAALEAERRKYLPNYALSPYGLMAAKKSPAQKTVLRSKRKKNFYRTPGGQVIYYPGLLSYIFILTSLHHFNTWK